MSEAKKLHSDPIMEKAIAYLYAVHIMRRPLNANFQQLSAPIMELINRAAELSITVPDPHEICGKEDDPYSCAIALAKYGDQFVEQEKKKPSIVGQDRLL